MNTISRETESIKKDQMDLLEIKNIISKIENALGFNSRSLKKTSVTLNMGQYKLSKLKHKTKKAQRRKARTKKKKTTKK